MSGDTLEAAVLDGSLFRDQSASLSEYRDEDRQTPTTTNTDDDLGSDLEDDHSPLPPPSAPSGYNTSGPSSRTGPKGVIRDQKEAAEAARVGQMLKAREAGERLEAKALLGPTWYEEEEMRRQDKLKEEEDGENEAKRRWREKRLRELEGGEGGKRGRRKGYLREVGMEGYLNAVEDGGTAVVLVYEPNLASLHPPPHHSFLLARASTLGFSLLPSGEPDLDVLPTLLVYGPDGDLAHTWVRIDLDLQGQSTNLEAYLLARGIVPIASHADSDGSEDDEEEDRE